LVQASILVLLACGLSYATIALDLKLPPPPNALHELTIKEARARQAELLWVDVRNPDRYESAHIPGALPFSEADSEASIAAVKSAWKAGRKVCVYGEGIGSERAERVAKSLRAALATREVYLLEGGWAAWPRP
jgi:rhodanese-related sulfurtransferase